MAVDWLKMRTDLYRDPKVCVMADILMEGESDLARYVSQNMQCDMTVTRNVMRNAIVGALLSVWGVTRHRGKRVDDDLVVYGVTCDVVDDIADMHGFGDAMVSVKWLTVNDECIVFPRFFEEYNVDPTEDAKAKNAERQRRYREKTRNANSNVTVTSQSNVREEKRRDITPISPNGDFDTFWKAYPRKENKGSAVKAWKKIKSPPIDQMLKALEWQRESDQWKKENGQFIPYPSTWLNGQRWLDEPAAQVLPFDPFAGALHA